MTQKVYGIGYSKRTQDEIKKLALTLDATVFDVRFSPRSRNPVWSGKRLAEALGDRYEHVRDFGNRNFKGGPIDLVNFAGGLQRVLDSPKPVILMCVCGDPKKCHRTTVGKLLAAQGIEFVELGGPEARLDPTARRARQLTLGL